MSHVSRLNGFRTKSVSLVFALFLILRNVQRGTTVDISFCPSYYGSSSPKKKKTYRGEEKSGSSNVRGGHFLPFNFKLIFDLLNVIIWTSSPVSNLFKIKFYSQVSLNYAICVDGLKATD